ncbi:hypothetical protein J6590_023221 [Homalodisca vitripennis]|nr:hypothetical protein J6590_023221 [Homalodisca vitripennis]
MNDKSRMRSNANSSDGPASRGARDSTSVSTTNSRRCAKRKELTPYTTIPLTILFTLTHETLHLRNSRINTLLTQNYTLRTTDILVDMDDEHATATGRELTVSIITMPFDTTADKKG